MKAIAPGKLILSGEHAVVYGSPALAMAVDRYAQSHITYQESRHVLFDLLNLSYQKSHTIEKLKKIKRRLQNDYESFLKGEFSIKDVLKKPIELSQYALTNIFEKMNLTLKDGICLSTHSTIPVGCGMGSSSAIILSMLYSIAHYFKSDISKERLLSMAMEIENLQHGRSSGLDLQISLHGGCHYFHEGEMQKRSLPGIPMYLVNTGKPESGTGECVMHAAQKFQNSQIGDDFTAVTQFMDTQFQENNIQGIQEAIKQNHQLLVQIGVVPEKVQHFIHQIAKHRVAAKICGAGAIRGSNAGVVLIVSQDDPTKLCEQYGYECARIYGQEYGLRTA